MEILFDAAERSVLQTAAAHFRFRVTDEVGPNTLRVEPIEHRRGVVVQLRPLPADAGDAEHELIVRPRRRRRMPAGTHVFRVTVRTRDDVALAAADAVLKVVPCVRVEEPVLIAGGPAGPALLRVAMSSRCGCTVTCAVRASHAGRALDAPPLVSVGLQTVEVTIPVPVSALDGRPFDLGDVELEVRCDDGTVIRRGPRGQVRVTWSRSAGTRRPRRGRPVRVGPAVGPAQGTVVGSD
ncbi:MAG TPA: hypothetical protein VIB48_25160 [Acidimicrobiia bacterium]